MNNSKKLKLILQIFICILIILIGIVGIYTKDGNMYINLLPNYTLGSDINGITILEFEVDDTKEKIYYDKEGNEVDSSKVTDKNKDDYTTKEVPVNSEESLNIENYNKVVDIMERRLNFLGVDQYQMDLDKETGAIVINVEDDYMEDIVTFLPMEAKLQLIDSNTGDVVIDYTDFKSAEPSYASLTRKSIAYINLKLNDSGVEKINNIDKYKTAVSSKENKEKEDEESKLLVMFDNQEMSKVSYDDILLTGKTLRVTTAKDIESDAELNSELNTNAIMAKLATIGKMPVIYNLVAEEFVKNDINNVVNYIILGLITICIVISIIFIFKYKLNGMLAVLGFGVNISLFLILIKYTAVQISLNVFAGMVGFIILNTLLTNNILKAIRKTEKTFSENVKNAYTKTSNTLVITLITFIVFSFSGMTVINSMGLSLFWGWVATVFGNLIFTVPMLAITNKK